MNVIPESIIAFYLQKIVLDIKNSIENDTTFDKTENYINDIFGDVVIDDFNLKREALNLFLKEKPFEIKLGFNLTTDDDLKKPLILIMVPKEEETMNTIGEIDHSEEVDNDSLVHAKSFHTTFNLMIICNNADVVVLLYRVLQSMFMVCSAEMEQSGLINISFAGFDMIPDKNVEIPVNVYSRIFALEFSYRNTIPFRHFDIGVDVKDHAEFEGTLMHSINQEMENREEF